MSFLLKVVVPALAGGAIGAIGLSLLTVLVHWLWEPKVLADGQYAFVFFVTVPAGFWLGAATAIGIVYAEAQRISMAGWVCIVASLCLLSPALLLTLSSFGAQGRIKESFVEFLFWWGLSALWASGLLYRGLHFLKKL